MISVAMTTYNGEKYIEEQIASILSQTCTVDELVICDDCSTDRTVEIITRIKDTNTSDVEIILYVNKQNLGFVENFYQAIGLTRGNLIFLCDQDDIWQKNKVERMSAIMKDNNLDFLCSNFNLIDENGDISTNKYIIPEFIEKAANGLNPIKLTSVVYANVAQGCTYCFSEKVKKTYIRIHYNKILHDYQIAVIGAATGNAAFINEKLISYRIHASNTLGFSEKKTLKHVKVRWKPSKPKMMELIDEAKRDFPVQDYYKCCFICYLRLPLWKAVIKRFI